MEKEDINFKVNDEKFNLRVSALIIKDNKILVQKRKNDKVWALPGGKLKMMERAEDGIRREISEELDMSLTNIKFLSVTENFFEINNEKNHQYIFNFSAEIDSTKYDGLDEFESVEIGKDVIYKWIDLDKIDDYDIRPDNIKKQIEDLKNNKITFFSIDEIKS